MNITYF